MNQIDKNDFGKFIAKKRKEKNMTQKDIAENLYISVQAVSKWERGQSLPDISLLMPLAKILDVNLVNLLEAKEDEEEKDPIETENLLEKILLINEEKTMDMGKSKLKRSIILLIIFSLLALEYYFLDKYLDIGIENFIGIGIVGVIFSIYLWILVDERLPSYYDENKISFVSKGFFRINIAGIYFNNRNWKHILNYLRIWILAMMFISPFLEGLILRNQNQIALILFMLIFFLSLFGPLYLIGKRYE